MKWIEERLLLDLSPSELRSLRDAVMEDEDHEEWPMRCLADVLLSRPRRLEVKGFWGLASLGPQVLQVPHTSKLQGRAQAEGTASKG